MNEKHYVLQSRFRDWEKCETCPGHYSTVNEAEAARKQKPFQNHYRIAESYTVVRYKAVKV